MSGRNEQQKLGTTRGSPRRSRTAKTSRISRRAVKSRCACEWGGWGRISDDGSGQNNLDPSEGPWGGGYPTHHGGALSSPRPGSVRENRSDHEMHERRKQTRCWTAHAGSRLKPAMRGKVLSYMPAFQPCRGKPAVRNDRDELRMMPTFPRPEGRRAVRVRGRYRKDQWVMGLKKSRPGLPSQPWARSEGRDEPALNVSVRTFQQLPRLRRAQFGLHFLTRLHSKVHRNQRDHCQNDHVDRYRPSRRLVLYHEPGGDKWRQCPREN